MSDEELARGCWTAHYYDNSGATYVFLTEVEALRHALMASMTVEFVKWGDCTS